MPVTFSPQTLAKAVEVGNRLGPRAPLVECVEFVHSHTEEDLQEWLDNTPLHPEALWHEAGEHS